MTMVGFTNYSEEWWHFDVNFFQQKFLTSRVGEMNAGFSYLSAGD